jgi:hypothetical protein
VKDRRHLALLVDRLAEAASGTQLRDVHSTIDVAVVLQTDRVPPGDRRTSKV